MRRPPHVGAIMSSKKFRRREQEMLSLVSEVGPGDGVDPRKYFRKERSPVDDHKMQRLCGHVARMMALTLDGVEDAEVISVAPVAGATKLLVTFGPPAGGEPLE